jgi:ribonuclease R
VAVEAEREMVDLVKCAFMRPRLGEVFAGAVTGVARHGVYVTLDAFFVEGLVPAAALRGRFELDEHHHAFVARRGRGALRLGSRARVRVAQVELVRAWLDFELIEVEA